MSRLQTKWDNILKSEGLVLKQASSVNVDAVNLDEESTVQAEAQYRYFDAFAAYGVEHDCLIATLMGEGANQSEIMEATGRGRKYVNNRLNEMRVKFGFSLEPELFVGTHARKTA